MQLINQIRTFLITLRYYSIWFESQIMKYSLTTCSWYINLFAEVSWNQVIHTFIVNTLGYRHWKYCNDTNLRLSSTFRLCQICIIINDETPSFLHENRGLRNIWITFEAQFSYLTYTECCLVIASLHYMHHRCINCYLWGDSWWRSKTCCCSFRYLLTYSVDPSWYD